jgi:hypothetical protein
MQTLLSLRTNILYNKVGEVFKKHFEIILLVDKPSYEKTNEDEIIRKRGIDELRFVVSEDNFDKFVKILEDIKTVKEEELK